MIELGMILLEIIGLETIALGVIAWVAIMTLDIKMYNMIILEKLEIGLNARKL